MTDGAEPTRAQRSAGRGEPRKASCGAHGSILKAVALLLAALWLWSCHGTELGKCTSARRQLLSKQLALEAQVADLQQQVATLRETEQGARAFAVDTLGEARKAEADGSMPGEVLPKYAIAIEALARFEAHFPKSEYAELMARQMDEAKARQSHLKVESALVDAFDSAVGSHDFGNAKDLLGQLAPKLCSKSIEELQAKLEDASNIPLETTIREVLADPGRYSGKLLKLGPLAVESNEITGKAFRTCQSTGSGELDYDVEACLRVSYDRAADRDRWRDLSADAIPRIIVFGRSGTTEYGAPMIRAWKIDLP